MNQFRRVLVVGAAVARHLSLSTAELIAVSRTPSQIGSWIEADVSNISGIKVVNRAIANSALDALLYMGGSAIRLVETH